ncbi:MAG TPA: hypothetical protein VI485_01775 [Vicinamibacterales bacterium]|nr:hypothetical protein [Vicinamibacterales bacterium]
MASSISGLYIGSTDDGGSPQELHLRVDVDEPFKHALKLNRISGDLFEPGGLEAGRNRHLRSWFMEVSPPDPVSVPFQASGQVTFHGRSDAATLELTVDRDEKGLLATVTIDFGADGRRHYSCRHVDERFRRLTIHVDVCESITFRQPEYQIGNTQFPVAGTTSRPLTWGGALREAGVTVTSPEPTILDDSAKTTPWTTEELEAALEAQLCAQGLAHEHAWPRWFLWGVLASQHADCRNAGVMFDHKKPARQGFAVFLKFFGGLPAGEPTNKVEASLQRLYLLTWVHEVGHALNLLHSRDKLVPSELSWMNDDHALEDVNGFWSKFPFTFSVAELLHLRHGHWPEIVPGAEPLGAGGHLCAPLAKRFVESTPAPITDSDPPQPLELLLRSRGHFDFMARVTIEVRLRNQHPEAELRNVVDDLSPEAGYVTVVIRRPDGRFVEFVPMIKLLRTPSVTTLASASKVGPDRHSVEIDLTYGRGGFYFDTPGEYLVCAIYAADNHLVESNRLRLRVGHPLSREADQMAQDFFVPEVGRCLMLNGSQSPFLTGAFATLLRMVDRWAGTEAGADLALALMPGVGNSFFAVRNNVVTLLKGPDHGSALRLTEAAVKTYEASSDRSFNLRHDRLVRARARYHQAAETASVAVTELVTLHDRLQDRGAHESVLADVRAFAKEVAGPLALPW